MRLEKVEEIVYTLDINTQGKLNEQLLLNIQGNTSDICKAHTNTLQHILMVIIKKNKKYPFKFIN